MENHKLRSLHRLVSRTQKPLDAYLAALRDVVQRLMGHYEELDEEWRVDREKFLELMIADGCFMLEILNYFSSEDFPNDGKYAANDPIFSTHSKLYNMPFIRRDMLLLENQIPLLVLERLLTVQKGEDKREKLIHSLVLRFCTSNIEYFDMGLGLHVLDVVRKSLLCVPYYKRASVFQRPSALHHPEKSVGVLNISSATQLMEAGIGFKMSKSSCLKDIEFTDGVLSLPQIVMDV